MKRLVLGLLLASLTLGIGLAAGAVPYLQDHNVIYSANAAGTEAWVLIYNDYNAGKTVNAAYITAYAGFTISASGSFVQPLGGAKVSLTAAIVGADISQSSGKMHRMLLGTDLGPGGYVVLHLLPTANGRVIKLFEAQLINLSIF